jgi:hypothetical protein
MMGLWAEELEVKLGVEKLSKRDESVAEAGRGGVMSAGWYGAFRSILVGDTFLVRARVL